MNSLLPFVMAGDPNLEVLPRWLRELGDAGIETVEVGVPHSDPVADGPMLQASAERAIRRGVTLGRVLETLRAAPASPAVVLFTYLNPLLAFGVEALVDALAGTPVQSLLVVDLPPGEDPAFEDALGRRGYPMVPVLAPTTTAARLTEIMSLRPDPGDGLPFAKRFAYVMARMGVTGVATHDMAPVAERVATLRAVTSRPLAVGFGVSRIEEVRALREMGVTPVVGSALVERLSAGDTVTQALAALGLCPE